MTWTKLGDEWTDETWKLSDAAARLLVDLHVWSNRKLLDCQVPLDDLERASRAADALDELLDGGWCASDGETITVRYHATYQRTREQVLRQQEVNKANRRKGRERPVRDKPSDDSSDERSDERVGSGSGLEKLTEEKKNARTRASDNTADCSGCQRYQVFGTTPCPDHKQAVA